MAEMHIDDRAVSAGGKSYGYWWYSDDFDKAIDNVLKARARVVPGERIAVDIGCAVGERALNLASLGVFREVVACDIENRASDIARHARQKILSQKSIHERNGAFHEASREASVPVRFLKAGIAELRPWHFEGSSVGFINCRNVGHFLTPGEFRQGLQNIADIAAHGTFVALSFDSHQATRGPRLSLYDNISHEGLVRLNSQWRLDNIHNYSYDPEHTGARAIYDETEVRSYLCRLGFTMLKLKQAVKESDDWRDEGSPNLRPVEARLFAVRNSNPAPGPSPSLF